jgi:S1-C subfamily serine protease
VIGNPTGLIGTVSDGIISAFRDNRSIIQITAPISHGSSGSPVMDESGQVIGIATLEIAEGQNLNFAIPVEKVPVDLTQLPKTYVYSGGVFYNQKLYDKAINDYSEAIRLDPTMPSPTTIAESSSKASSTKPSMIITTRSGSIRTLRLRTRIAVLHTNGPVTVTRLTPTLQQHGGLSKGNR